MPLAAKQSFLHHYAPILWLLAGIGGGSVLGLLWPQQVLVIKPIGDIFLNLLFTAVIPLVFFAIAATIASLSNTGRTGRLISIMTVVFLATVLLASLITVVATWIFPVTQQIAKITAEAPPPVASAGEQIVQLISVSDFYELLSRKHMLALLLFATLTGIATRRAGIAGERFREFLVSGNEVMKQLLSFIMKLAPLGLGAYFAFQVATIGPQLFGTYAQALAVCHGVSLFYYLCCFSTYAFIAGGITTVAAYWRYNLLPSATALGTCSSIATLPANLQAAAQMNIPVTVRDVVIPLGATLHKEGSAIAAVLKIVIAFAMVQQPFTGIPTILLALLIALLVSIIEGGIPNGGYVGQLLIVAAYNLPVEVLPVIMIIGTLMDPIATLLNATGDTVAAMLISRWVPSSPQPAPVTDK